MSREDFLARTRTLFRYARAALIYLCMSVRSEEAMREPAGGQGFTMAMILDTWEDDWKR